MQSRPQSAITANYGPRPSSSNAQRGRFPVSVVNTPPPQFNSKASSVSSIGQSASPSSKFQSPKGASHNFGAASHHLTTSPSGTSFPLSPSMGSPTHFIHSSTNGNSLPSPPNSPPIGVDFSMLSVSRAHLGSRSDTRRTGGGSPSRTRPSTGSVQVPATQSSNQGSMPASVDHTPVKVEAPALAFESTMDDQGVHSVLPLVDAVHSTTAVELESAPIPTSSSSSSSVSNSAQVSPSNGSATTSSTDCPPISESIPTHSDQTGTDLSTLISSSSSSQSPIPFEVDSLASAIPIVTFKHAPAPSVLVLQHNHVNAGDAQISASASSQPQQILDFSYATEPSLPSVSSIPPNLLIAAQRTAADIHAVKQQLATMALNQQQQQQYQQHQQFLQQYQHQFQQYSQTHHPPLPHQQTLTSPSRPRTAASHQHQKRPYQSSAPSTVPSSQSPVIAYIDSIGNNKPSLSSSSSTQSLSSSLSTPSLLLPLHARGPQQFQHPIPSHAPPSTSFQFQTLASSPSVSSLAHSSSKSALPLPLPANAILSSAASDLHPSRPSSSVMAHGRTAEPSSAILDLHPSASAAPERVPAVAERLPSRPSGAPPSTLPSGPFQVVSEHAHARSLGNRTSSGSASMSRLPTFSSLSRPSTSSSSAPLVSAPHPPAAATRPALNTPAQQIVFPSTVPPSTASSSLPVASLRPLSSPNFLLKQSSSLMPKEFDRDNVSSSLGPNQLQLFEEAIAHIDDDFTASSSSSTLDESQSAAQKLKSSSLALAQLANLFESSQQYASAGKLLRRIQSSLSQFESDNSSSTH